ncbi:hypothetical protein LTR28_006601 [Elasticomyces elasticus]|nr:hypothetical protein LTR28_006601 [Elasticomyces elasticus]
MAPLTRLHVVHVIVTENGKNIVAGVVSPKTLIEMFMPEENAALFQRGAARAINTERPERTKRAPQQIEQVPEPLVRRGWLPIEPNTIAQDDEDFPAPGLPIPTPPFEPLLAAGARHNGD